MTAPTCACGCGAEVKPHTRNNKGRGYVKGELQRFKTGHNPSTGKSKKYPMKTIGGRTKPVHVLVAQKALGRELPAGAEVHHVDGNKCNNTNANLVICQNHRYHHLLHVRQRVLAAGGNPNTQRICSTCKNVVLITQLVGRLGKPRTASCCYACSRVIGAKRRMAASQLSEGRS